MVDALFGIQRAHGATHERVMSSRRLLRQDWYGTPRLFTSQYPIESVFTKQPRWLGGNPAVHMEHPRAMNRLAAAVAPCVTEGVAHHRVAPPSPSGESLCVEFVQTAEDLARLEADWTDLFKRAACRNPFLSHQWMATWWKHWGAGHCLITITIRDHAGRLVALAPFYSHQEGTGRLRSRSVRFLGSQHVGSDYLTILCESERWVDDCVARVASSLKELRAEWDFMELRDVDEESAALCALRAQLKTAGMSETVTTASTCPYTPLPASGDKFLAGLRSNLRYNFRRRRRTLEREGPLEFNVIEDPGTIAREFQHLVRLHSKRFTDKQEISSFLRPEVQRFHADAVQRMAEGGFARLYVLTLRGTCIAALYGFSAGHKFSFYQSGMDPTWSRLSVGLVMMGSSIQEAIRTGHREFDFLRGAEAYKFQWTSQTRRTLTVRLFDGRWRAQAVRLGLEGRELVANLVRVHRRSPLNGGEVQ